jgi:transposase
MALLENYTLREIVNTDIHELAEFLHQNSNNRLGGSTPIEKITTALKKAARNSYRLKPEIDQAITQTLSMTFDNIRFYQSQNKRLKKVLKRQLKAIPQTLITVDGIGPVLTAGIISEIGDINRFDKETNLASYAGLTWSQYQSGSFTAEETHLTKKGNKYLRYYLVEAANSLRVHNDRYKSYYYKKYNEVPKHKHKRALVLTARKFVRLVFALLSKGEIYQPRR